MSEIPIEFVLFALTLAGVAFFHRQTMKVALTGLAVISVYKIGFTGFKSGPGHRRFCRSPRASLGDFDESILSFVCFRLVGAPLRKEPRAARVAEISSARLKGGFILLAMIWVLSSFLDNIAAALVGGAMAHQLFRAKVHIGDLAVIVAASNAGGAWSVVGDTTTTMMWISGVSPLAVFEAIIASSVALLFFGICAAKQQHKYSPMLQQTHEPIPIDWARIGIVALMLVAAIVTNVTVNVFPPSYSDYFPFIGVAVWLVLLLSVAVRRPDWEVLGEVFKGSVFLLALVLCASMMPVEKLPRPSWVTALQLGFLSAVFDNIPLTALALKQGGYDWGFVAYAVGFGGSMIWFGSSAGVALSNLFPEARSVTKWLRHGLHIAVAYVIGFFAMLWFWSWHPDAPLAAEKAKAERITTPVTPNL